MPKRWVEAQYSVSPHGINRYSRYSIIVEAATNFRVWSLKVPRGSIALRVTKLRKNRSRRGKPIPPRENRGGRAGTAFLFHFACLNLHRLRQRTTADRPLTAAPRS